MDYIDILNSLYNGDLADIVSVLNKSTYPIAATGKEDWVIHTGFAFKLHTGTEMELVYNISQEKLVRQPRKENFVTGLPLVNGIRIRSKMDMFFNEFCPYIVQELTRKSDEYSVWIRDFKDGSSVRNFVSSPCSEVELAKNDGSMEILQKFTINDNNRNKSFPLQRRVKDLIFYDRRRFSVM